MYWLELLEQAGISKPGTLRPIWKETEEILAMTVASKKTLKARAGVRGFNGRPPRPPVEPKIVNCEP
jgi:hypothetical protein